MTCPECHREHVITGRVEVDGAELRPKFVEVMVEMACRHGLLGVPEPSDTLVEPDPTP